MKIIHLQAADSEGPTAAELAEIQQEWPLIAAELDLLDAEIAYINAGPAASALDRRRIRRAERQVLAVTRELADSDVLTDGAA
ncbi:hypothetical protein GCM10009789_19390 [Kribbella sancticallisti]|uniref:TraR/DksA family transcriptional regulator n=1 Tax=Kribbella sancticallisti TaxID=460087 RepID=A0ABP4NR82_9ACTN